MLTAVLLCLGTYLGKAVAPYPFWGNAKYRFSSHIKINFWEGNDNFLILVMSVRVRVRVTQLYPPARAVEL